MNKSSNLQELKKIGLTMLWSFLGTLGLKGIVAIGASESIRYSNSMFSFLIFIGLNTIFYKLLPIFWESGRKKRIYAYLFALALSMALHFGARMEAVENVRMTDKSLWFGIFCFALTFAPIVNILWDRGEELFSKVFINKNTENNKFNEKMNFYQIWGIIFLMWLPTFLALYPGAFVYDAQDEYIEVISRVFTTHHPLLHVLALGGIVHGAEYLGVSANAGIATYVILQMIIMSGILAYTLKLFEKMGMKKGWITAALIFYGIFPVFPMYGVCTAKDGLFTIAFFLMVMLLIRYIKADGFFSMRNMVLFLVSSVLMMMLRNNGIYAYAVSIPIIMLIKTKWGRNGKLALLMALSIVMSLGGNYVLKRAVDASDNEHQEILTVPIQQLARVHTYSKDVFSDEELATLYEILPEDYLITYRARVSDVVKSGFNNEVYEKAPEKYGRLWLDVGLRKPLIYINAWLGTSYGYWYPDAINNVYGGNQMYTFRYDESSYFGFETEPPGERDSKLKVVELFYENLSLKLFQQKVPVISMLFAPGFFFWLFAFVFVGILRMGKEKLDRIIPIIPVALLWLTVLLGPTTLVRYVLILWFLVPVYPILLSKEASKEEDMKSD